MVRGTLDIEAYREKVESAHDIVRKWAHNTPILNSSAINSIVGCEVYFKCENFQKIGAFKMRGAVNAVMSCGITQKEKGFVTHSSGNHAQAVALSSKFAKTNAHIVMPKGAPEIKINAVKGYGAQVYLCENNEASRVETCDNIIKETGANFIHPYDNEKVICGQATCAKEIFEELKQINVIMCPVGGGGLASGTIISTKLLKVQLNWPKKILKLSCQDLHILKMLKLFLLRII